MISRTEVKQGVSGAIIALDVVVAYILTNLTTIVRKIIEHVSEVSNNEARKTFGAIFMSLNPSVAPSGNVDLSNWKLILPVDSSGTTSDTAAEISNLSGYQNSRYFYTGSNGAMVFEAPVDGATTGDFFHDADGSDSGTAVKFAVIHNKAALAAADFLVV